MDPLDEVCVFSPGTLGSFASQCLRAVGVRQSDAEAVSDAMLDAQLRGVDSHGMTRLLTIYVERLEAGLINPKGAPRLVKDEGVTAIVDADNSLGPVGASLAVDLSRDRARTFGAAWIAVMHSNHFGACAYYGNQVASDGMIGIVFSNAPPAMAPWGGRKPYLGTNPMGISVPRRDAPPVSIDMATSVAAKGYIILAASEGRPIPPGWAIDVAGRATTDAREALAGSVLPMAGHKGYALALGIDILAGVLAGSAFGQGIGQLYGAQSQPQDVGHLIAAIDIAHFLPLEAFYDRLEQMIVEMQAIPLAEDSPGIFLPGEIEAQEKNRRLEAGIPVPARVAEQLSKLGDRLGVRLGSPRIS